MIKNKLKIALFSDTHGKEQELTMPDGDIDIAIFSGDAGTYKNPIQNVRSVLNFIDWYASLPNIKHKIWIAGNHCTSIEAGLVDAKKLSEEKGLIYLEDETITIEGLKIFGSPYTPFFYDWGFNVERGEDIKKHWNLIEPGTDVIISHGPVQGILDRCMDGSTPGCSDLLEKVREIKPLCFVSGHIHEAYGHELVDDVNYFNASVLNHRYEMTNKPFVIEIDENKNLEIIKQEENE
jgi:Icc-related predicted phosphoesterase